MFVQAQQSPLEERLLDTLAGSGPIFASVALVVLFLWPFRAPLIELIKSRITK
jgi:hypothetical protein